MTLIFEYDPNRVRMNQYAEYLGHMYFLFEIYRPDTHTNRQTHTADRSLDLDN